MLRTQKSPANYINFCSIARFIDPKSQVGWRLVSQPVAQALEELGLHQIQLLRPDGVRATDNHLSIAFGDRLRDGGDAAADCRFPLALNRCEWGARSRAGESRAEAGGGGTGCSAEGPATTACDGAGG